MKQLFALFFISCSLFAGAATTINGTVAWAKGETVKATVYEDYLTFISSIIGKTTIAEDGTFSLSLDLGNVEQVRLEVSGTNTRLYLQPDVTYKITIPEYQGEQSNVLSKLKFVQPEIHSEGGGQLNEKIDRFNRAVDQFMLNNAPLLVQKKGGKQLKSFKQEQKQKFKNEIDFLKNYVHYTLAQVQLATNYSRTEMFDEYVENRPLLFRNPEYMKFFKDYFNNYGRFIEMKEYEVKLLAAVNVHKSMDSLYSVFKTDHFLSKCSKELTQLVILCELYYQFDNGNYNRNAIRSVFMDAIKGAESTEVKKVAVNMLKKKKRLALGTMAPALNLPELGTGNTVSLKDFEGKHVYLDFWATWCKPCIEEMKLMKRLYEQYNPHVEFVSISIDKRERRAERFYEENDYPWTFLYMGNDDELKEIYDVVAIPMYYLIDGEGRLVQSPALRPSSGIEHSFQRIEKKKAEKREGPHIWEMNNKKSIRD